MPMPDSNDAGGEVQVGDRVAYRLSAGEAAHGIEGKVIGIFATSVDL